MLLYCFVLHLSSVHDIIIDLLCVCLCVCIDDAKVIGPTTDKQTQIQSHTRNTCTCFHTETTSQTLDLHCKFQPPRVKAVAAKGWGNFCG